MSSTLLATLSSWALVALAIAHLTFGIVKYRAPLGDALASGFVGRFQLPEVRRTGFWFVLFGLPLLLAGHLAVRALNTADFGLWRLVGAYLVATSIIGVAAFPRSPFPASLLVGILLVMAGYGY